MTAEEINFVRLNALLNTTSLENFGWGRHADGRAREGTFYIEPGIALVLGSQPPLDRAAPSPENGFIQPQSQYGRNDPNGGVAVSGPVTSNRSFDRITALFGDLREGTLYASTSSFDATDRPVFRVNMVNENGNPIATLKECTGGNRSDPRFFRFPDGSARMILERNGRIYRLTEITGNDPAPDPGLPTGDGNLIQPLADVPAGEVLFQWQRTNGATHILWRVTDSAGRVLDATRRVLSAYDCNNDNLCEWSKQLSQGDYGWDIQPFNKGTRLGDRESARFSVVGGGNNADGQPDNNNSGDDQTGNDSSGDGPLISPLGSIADNGSSPFEWTSINSADRYLWRVSDNRGNVIDATKRIPRGFGCQNDNRCTWSKPLPPGIYSWDIQAFRNNTKFGPRYAADFTIGSGDHQDNNDGDDSNDGQDGNSGNDDQGTNSPGALDLIAPINNTISTNSVTFEWSSLSAATRYLWRVLDNNGSLVDATKRVPKAYGCANGEDCQWTLSLRSGTYTWDIQAFAGNAKLGSRPSADFTVQ